MRRLHRIEMGTAAISAAAAAGCIVAFVSGVNPRSYVLIAAGAAATIGVVSLLLNALVAFSTLRRRAGMEPAVWRTHGDRGVGDGADSLRKRCEVLNQRLHVDEPHLCSQYMIACTCWSFCAGAVDDVSVAKRTSPDAQKLACERSLLAEEIGLAMVHRDGMDSCPFRFSSTQAGSAPADGAALDSSDTGSMRRQKTRAL